MSKIHFPQFGNRDYSPFEMRQLVQALELRFQTLESEVQPSTFDRSAFGSDELANLYAPLNHQHVVADITDFPTTVFFFDDVSGSPDDGDTLVWSGGSFVAQPGASGGAIELDDLSDVIADSASDGQTLVFDASTLRWRAEDQASSGIDTLFELLDTDLSGQGQYDLLFNADGDEWQETGTNFQWVADSYIQLGNDISINWYDESFLSRELLILKPTQVTVVPDPLAPEVQFFTDFESVSNADAGAGTMTEDSQNATVSATLDGQLDFETGINKFGSRSVYFTDGTSAPINFGDQAYFSLADNDWTMDIWVYFDAGALPSDSVLGSSGGGGHGLMAKWLDAGTRREWALTLNDDDQIQFEWSTTGANGFLWRTDTLTWTAGQWYYISMEREGDQLRAYRDGVQIAAAIGVDTLSSPADSFHNSDRALLIGSRILAGVNAYHAWGCTMDEPLLTVGTARYGGIDFTPPAVSYATGVGVSVDRTFIVGDPAIDTTIDGATTTITGDGVVDGDTTTNSLFTAQGISTFNAAIIANSTTDFNGAVEVNDGNTFSILENGNVARVDISHTGTALGFTGTGTTTELDLTNLNLNLGQQAYYAGIVGDKVSFFDNRLGATNMYGIGVESNTLYFKADSTYRWYSGANADGGASDVMELNAADWTLTANALVGTGHYLRVQDSTNADYWQVLHDGTNSVVSTNAGNINYAPAGGRVNLIAGTALWIFDATTSDTGQFSHNGTDFLTNFTNTVDWDVTGLSGEAFFDADLRVSGDLTVGGTTTTINSNVVSIADNIIVLNSDEVGAPTQDAGIEVERGTSANVFLQYNETTDRWEFTNDGTTYQNILLDSDLTTTGYTQAGVDETITGAWTFSGRPVVTATSVGGATGSSFRIEASNPQFSIVNDTAAADTGAWNVFVDTSSYNLRLMADDFATAVDALEVTRSGTTPAAWTFTGTTFAFSNTVSIDGSLRAIRTIGNGSVEVGNETVASTAFIDFHSSGNANDYDVRLAATGGTVFGTGDASITAASFDVNAQLRTATLSGRTADGPLNIYGGSGNTGANIEMYGSTHPSQANNAFHDAASHQFRAIAGASVYVTFNAANAAFITPIVVNTNDAGPMVTIGDGAGADGDSMLRFNIDRPWSFRQQGTGAGAALQLYAENAGKEFRIGSAANTTAFQFNPDSARFTTELITVTDTLSSIRGVSGQYENAPSAAWGGTIYGMGNSFDGAVSGVDSTSTSVYGLRWLRGSHFQADSRIGEGMYVYQNGALEGGIGAGGVYSAGPMEAVANLRTRASLIVGDSTARLLTQPTLRGTINAGGTSDSSGVGSYNGYSINNDIMFMHNGTAAGIYDEINDNWRIRFDTNSSAVTLGHATSTVMRTHGVGVDIAGTNSFYGLYDSGFTTRTAFLQSLTVLGDLVLRNEVHGQAVQIEAEDNAGTVRTLIEASPEGAVRLSENFTNNEIALATQGRTGDATTTAQVRHRNGSFYDVGMNVMPQIAVNANLTIDPTDIGGYFYHNNSTSYTITLNNSADIPVGSRFDIIKRGGTGTITIAQGTGVTITKFDGTTTITTGNIVIAASTVAWITVHKYDATNFFVTGAGLP